MPIFKPKPLFSTKVGWYFAPIWSIPLENLSCIMIIFKPTFSACNKIKHFYILFCTSRYGWGWKNFLEEANAGEGTKFPASKAYRFYLTYILPIVIVFIFIMAYVTLFKK